MSVDQLVDAGYLPHTLIRVGIRRQLSERVNHIKNKSLSGGVESKMQFLDRLRSSPIAVEVDKANSQHYEVETGVFKAMLGPRMKYSCCLYPTGNETLAEAEVAMLSTYLEKAEVKDGMDILDLG